MNLSSFPGFPGFLNSERPPVHPKLRVKLPKVEYDVESEIKEMIEKLKKIETPEYRAKASKEHIEAKRRMYTFLFKNLLIVKERDNK